MWSIIYLFISLDFVNEIKVLCNIKAADCELKPGSHQLPLVYTVLAGVLFLLTV